ncbi:MAG: HAD family hydrolase [Leucobacter sp.]
MTEPRTIPDLDNYDAYLFDLDGVITPTVELHMRAWAETFDEFFAERGETPYDEREYYDSLDGRPRFAGVATLLAARGVTLPPGTPNDDGFTTVTGVGNRKNHAFTRVLERDGIAPYPGSLDLLDVLAAQRVPLAVVSSSRNAEAVLAAAGLRERFVAVVDGSVAEREGLPGKPAPDTFLRAASLLGVEPARAVVLEDAGSGVAAGVSGGFGLVIGVDRGAGAELLRAAGAHAVVADLKELIA